MKQCISIKVSHDNMISYIILLIMSKRNQKITITILSTFLFLLISLLIIIKIASYSDIFERNDGIQDEEYISNSALPISSPIIYNNESAVSTDNIKSLAPINKNPCKADFLVMQMINTSGEMYFISDEILSMVGNKDNYNQDKVEEYLLTTEYCNEALNSWLKNFDENDEGDFQYDCIKKISQIIKTISLTLEYLEQNPNSYDKLKVTNNIKSIQKVLDSYSRIQTEIVMNLDADRGVMCEDLDISTY